VGRYAIYGKIAVGGMASVHFGRMEGAAGFSRTVAIKRLHPHLAEDPDFRSTMIDEARLAARIHHPNVVPTLDVVAADGELLVVMEYVRGESLARLLREAQTRRAPMPRPIASAIAIGALHGLHAAHEATSDQGEALGIVHRDVSPQNLLVGIDGVPRVIDFGVAKAAGRLQRTNEGAIKGKVAYMAPEQLAVTETRLSGGTVTRAADVYALGALLWEMLAGRPLFPGENDAQRAFQVLQGAREPPSRYAHYLLPHLDALVMRALALDPAARFRTAMEMAEALLQAIPPAFSTEVGKWVEEVAAEALSRRSAELAGIESSSAPTREVSAVRLGPGARREPSASTSPGAPTVVALIRPEDMPTVSSQPSSLSVETPRSGVHGSRPHRARLKGGFGGALLLALGLGILFGPRLIAQRLAAQRASVATVASTPQLTSGSAAVPSSSPIPPPPEPRPSPHSTEPAPLPPPHPAPPPHPRPKLHGAPKSPAPFRFTQPD
jgi:serine/threonine-protein kinase